MHGGGEQNLNMSRPFEPKFNVGMAFAGLT